MDVNYAISYPLMKPYSSLYPTSKRQKTKSSGDDADADANDKPEEIDGPKGDVMVWKLVEQALEEGSLEQLRNSKNREEIPGAPSKKGSNSRTAKTKDARKTDATQTPLPKKSYAPLDAPRNRREARAAAREADEDSDGGFFE